MIFDDILNLFRLGIALGSILTTFWNQNPCVGRSFLDNFLNDILIDLGGTCCQWPQLFDPVPQVVFLKVLDVVPFFDHF